MAHFRSPLPSSVNPSALAADDQEEIPDHHTRRSRDHAESGNNRFGVPWSSEPPRASAASTKTAAQSKLTLAYRQNEKFAALGERLKNIALLQKKQEIASEFPQWTNDVLRTGNSHEWPELSGNQLDDLLSQIIPSSGMTSDCVYAKLLHILRDEQTSTIPGEKRKDATDHNKIIESSISRLIETMPDSIRIKWLAHIAIWYGISDPIISDSDFRLNAMNKYFAMIDQCADSAGKFAKSKAIATGAEAFPYLTIKFDTAKMYTAVDLFISAVEKLKSDGERKSVMGALGDVSQAILDVRLEARGSLDKREASMFADLDSRLQRLIDETGTRKFHSAPKIAESPV